MDAFIRASRRSELRNLYTRWRVARLERGAGFAFGGI